MTATLFELIETLPDPRAARGVRHKASTILKLLLLGFSCRLVAVEHIVNFFRPLWSAVGPELGSDRTQPPDATTVRRVLEEIDRDEFERIFRKWTAEIVKDQNITAAVDGKVLCGSACQKVLNVFAHDIKLALAQEDIAEGEGESTTLRKALSKLFDDYPGLSILTGDAAYCGRDLCQAIKEAGRHYIVQAKENQKGIHQQVRKWFDEDVQKRPPDAITIKKNPRRRRSEKSGLSAASA